MSTDDPHLRTVSSVSRRLPDRETVIENLLFFCYFTILILGLTLLVTLELSIRL
jgi:hypothetical protein